MKSGLLISIVVGSCLLGVVSMSGPSSNTPVRIKRIMACNQTGWTDEAGDFEDFIELCNNTNQTVTVGGMYLSDSAAANQRWQIPTGTKIGANSTLRIWTDGEPDEGPLHASFRLNRNGERVMLFDNNNVLVDAVIFPRQRPDVVFVAAK